MLFLSRAVINQKDGFGIPLQVYVVFGNCDGLQVSIPHVRKRFEKVGDSFPFGVLFISYKDFILPIAGSGLAGFCA